MNLFDLHGRVALVTGSSRGLGFAMARGLGEAGATVVVNSRNRASVEDVARNMKAEGLNCHAYAFDVTEERDVCDAVDAIEREVGPLDILVNNAGINVRASAQDFKTEDWFRVMDTNLNAVFYLSVAVGKRMIARRRGKIVNIASVSSEIARTKIAPYTASKGGVKMLTKGLAVDWAKHNVQVNAIGPGYFLTEMTMPLSQDEAFNAWVCERTPVGRWGKPEELVGTVVYLSSDASSYLTGQTIYVDGGLLSSF